MNIKREVWVVERENNETVSSSTSRLVAESALALGDPCWQGHHVTRYIPAPQPIDGWPKEDGWYWAIYADSDIRVVEVSGDIAEWGDITVLSKKYFADERACFYGPLLPPEVER